MRHLSLDSGGDHSELKLWKACKEFASKRNYIRNMCCFIHSRKRQRSNKVSSYKKMIFASSGCVYIIKNYKNKNPYFLTVKILPMIYYEMRYFLITDS